MADFYLNAGDTASPIFETLEDETGVAVDIQGATVKITVTPIHGGTPTINDKAALNLQIGDGSDGSLGQVSYGEGAAPYAGGETSTAGDYLYTWKITYAGGQIQTFPNDGYRLLTITPDAPIVAQEYASVEELKKTLNLSSTTYADQDIKLALLAASEGINNHCERLFTLGSSQTRKYYPVSTDYVRIHDATTVTAVVVNGTTLVQDTDYYLDPVRITFTGPPYDVLRAIPGALLPGYGPFGMSAAWGPVSVTGTYGWPAVPASIKQAAIVLAGRFLQRGRSAPFAILTFGDGGEAARLTRSDPDVATMLEPYVRRVYE